MYATNHLDATDSKIIALLLVCILVCIKFQYLTLFTASWSIYKKKCIIVCII